MTADGDVIPGKAQRREDEGVCLRRTGRSWWRDQFLESIGVENPRKRPARFRAARGRLVVSEEGGSSGRRWRKEGTVKGNNNAISAWMEKL